MTPSLPSPFPTTTSLFRINGEETVGTFYKKELQKINQKEFRVEKVIKRKGGKLHVKWKGYDSFFNSWNDEKDINECINEYNMCISIK